jgi:hypothetical protein
MTSLTGLCDGIKVHISDFNKDIHSKILCQVCDGPLIPKRGSINMHHYAHKSNENCILNHKDLKTPWHLLWQNIMKPEYIECIINKNSRTHIADIKTDLNLVIEVQHSYLSEDEIIERESFYDNMIWILDGTNSVKFDKLKTEYFTMKCNKVLECNNGYSFVKTSYRFWRNMKKIKYIDTGSNLLRILEYMGNDIYLCREIDYRMFIIKKCLNIIKDPLDLTVSKLESFSNVPENITVKREPGSKLKELGSTNKKLFYFNDTKTFSGPGAYDVREFLEDEMGFIYSGGSWELPKWN